MKLIDTHAHLHEPGFGIDVHQAVDTARAVGVQKIITVGTNAAMSQAAVDFAARHATVWASVGLHPHHAEDQNDLGMIDRLSDAHKVVAIGECGLDYYYLNSPKTKQRQVLIHQAKLAEKLELPIIIHIRSAKDDIETAYDDLWRILDKFELRGVLHSFTGSLKQMEAALERGYYIALNGIMTFSKDPQHEIVCREVPMEKLVLETDSPLLTPDPFRGTVNEPKYVELIAAHLAEVRGVTKQTIAAVTTANAENLFLME